LLSSCVAYQTGNLTSTSAGSKFIYEDVAIGTAKADRIWGLGGIRKDALVAEAKRQLMTARPLAQSEEYINFTIDFKRSFILILDRSKVTLTADVIRLTANEPKECYLPLYLNKMFLVNLQDDLFKIGDYIMTEGHLTGQILAINKNQKATVSLKNKRGEIITRRKHLRELYNRATVFKGLKAGDNFAVTNMGEITNCIIVGLGKQQILLLTPKGQYVKLDYPK
jgi:hypothetical protein